MHRPAELREQIANLPNLLSLARIGAIPIFMAFAYQPGPLNAFVAALLFGVAAITDLVDGYLARQRGLVTVLGKFLDPLADKLFMMAALLVLVQLGRVPAWVVIIILAREFTITSLRAIASSEGVVIAAGQGGKWKAALQNVGIIGLLLHYEYDIDLLFAHADVSFHRAGLWLLYASVLLSITSAYQYIRDFLRGVSPSV